MTASIAAGVDISMGDVIQHDIVMNGAKRGMSYSDLDRFTVAPPAVAVGPSVLRSGALSTEIVLRHEKSRIRVTYQHAPTDQDALKIFRVTVAREGDDVAWLATPFDWYVLTWSVSGKLYI